MQKWTGTLEGVRSRYSKCGAGQERCCAHLLLAAVLVVAVEAEHWGGDAQVGTQQACPPCVLCQNQGSLPASSWWAQCLRTRLAQGLFEESGQQLWVCCHDTAPLSGMQSRQPSPQAAGATSF